MNRKPAWKRGLWLAAIALGCVLGCTANAQIKFAQLTDPHLFDDETSADRENDRAALISAIKKINERTTQGANYDFVVITGDLGIEALIVKKGSQTVDEALTSSNLTEKAKDVAGILARSLVRRWIFVAGNNDLDDENPFTIRYYNSFIESLKQELKEKEIIDLSRPGGTNVYRTGGLSFFGFNDASFKNQNDAKRLKCVSDGQVGNDEHAFPTHTLQLKEVQAVHDRIKSSETPFVYVFYHIPEIDDPYLIKRGPADEDLKSKLDNKSCIGEANVYSPWFVSKRIRDEWNEIVTNEKVKGLFAGHFHDGWRPTYENSRWMRSAAYPSGSVSKLYVCPPLAIKLQQRNPEQARGFQEVSINQKGDILDEFGKNGVHLFWYDQATSTFSTDFDDVQERLAVQQLRLGQLFENSGRLKDAEDAYTKALGAVSNNTREVALSGLNRALVKQSSPLNRYILVRRPISLESSVFLGAVVILLLSMAVSAGDRVSLARRQRSLRAVTTTVLIITVALFIWLVLWAGDGLFPEGWILGVSPNLLLLMSAVLISMTLLLLRQIMRVRGQGKLLIIPLVDITEHRLGGTFPQIFSMVREDMLSVRNFGIIGGSGPPIIVLGEDVELVELIESTFGGVWGKVIGWSFRKAARPEYTVRGTLQTGGAGLDFTAVLERRGKILQSWHRTFIVGHLFAEQRQLSQDVLTFIED